MFSYKDSGNNTWSVSAQTSSSYSKATATSVTAQPLGGSCGRTVEVTESTDEHGTERTHTDTTTWTSASGEVRTSSVTQTDATSADGRQEYHSTQTTNADGTTSSASTECYDGECRGTGATGTTVQDEIEEPGTAYRDPDYMEYVASPEVMDATMTLRQGPVQIVNPLDAEEQYFQFTVSGVMGNDVGPVALYTPDAYEAMFAEPVILHMPFTEDRAEGPPEETPTPDDGYQGGQCIYCNQGGDE